MFKRLELFCKRLIKSRYYHLQKYNASFSLPFEYLFKIENNRNRYILYTVVGYSTI